MLSSPVCDLAPELQTSEIPEGFMKHPVQAKSTRLLNFNKYVENTLKDKAVKKNIIYV
jgi:hypothetical protein